MLRHFNQPGPAETMKELAGQGLTTQSSFDGEIYVLNGKIMQKSCALIASRACLLSSSATGHCCCVMDT